MSQTQPNLWTLRIFGTPDQLGLVEDLLLEEALALSLLEAQPDRSAHIEVIYDVEPVTADVRTKLSAIDGSLTFEITPVDHLDWVKKGCELLAPLPIARWTIFGAAYRDQLSKETIALQIEATSAFGTGEHPTTRGCLILLDKLYPMIRSAMIP